MRRQHQSNSSIRAGLIQLRHHGDYPASQLAAEQALAEAAAAGATLALLPELHLHPYFCQTHNNANFDLAEPLPGPYTEWLSGQSKKLKLVIVGSTFERCTPGVFYNTAVVTDNDGSLAGCYRKQHLPEDPGYHEKFYFSPGDETLKCIDTAVGRLGVLICWDQWFPEPARILALDGADLLLYPSAIGWAPADNEDERQRQLDAWQLVQRGHAVANGLPVLACNRVGNETTDNSSGQRFWGGSFAAGPQGEMLCSAGHTRQQVLLANLDPQRRQEVRRVWPFFRDRRVDQYQPIISRTAQ